jgi:hypothetical protein
MAVAMLVHSPRLGTRDYDRLIASLELDAQPPAGQLLHLAVERDGAVECTEIWQTAAAALAFVEHRLAPALEAMNLQGPEVELLALHNLFTADLDAVGLIGGVSLPAHVAGAALY